MIAKEVFKKHHQKITPILIRLEERYIAIAKAEDLENYKRTGKHPLKQNNTNIEIKIKICNYFQRIPKSNTGRKAH